MAKIKLMTVVGTRPEIIRLSRIIIALDAAFDHILVHTGQNYDYELNKVFFDELGLRRPDHFLNAASGSASTAETIGNIISKIDKVIEKEKPNAFFVLGDTNSCLSVISAKKRKIPIFHMEAGNRCFDERVPEEVNRKIVDHISDINLTYSSIAREYLIKEGFPVDRIIRVGSPMLEVLKFYYKDILASKAIVSLGLEPGKYFLLSAHREENVQNPSKLKILISTLNEIAKKYKHPIIVSTHPRTLKSIEAIDIEIDPLVRLEKPFGFFDYIFLQLNARVVLSDSGTISEEAAILNLRALNLREAHERPEAMEEASVMMVGFNTGLILNAIDVFDYSKETGFNPTPHVRDYCVDNVSSKIVSIINSYVDYINRVVWKKY